MANKAIPIGVSLSQETINWIDNQVKINSKFRNRSHLFEEAIKLLREAEK